jgi:hypothetical protein
MVSDVDNAGDVRSLWSLECIDCDRVSTDNERYWTARLTIDDPVVIHCPVCGRREFGQC